MKSNKLRWVSFSLAILVCGYLTSSICVATADDVNLPELVSKIKSQVKVREELFVGLSVRIKQVRELDGTIEKQLDLTFNQLSDRVWRVDAQTEIDEGQVAQLVTTRDDDFCFEANDRGMGSFEYGKLGFDQAVRERLSGNWSSLFPFGVDPVSIQGTPLDVFLDREDISARWLSGLPDQQGRKVEGIDFDAPARGGTMRGTLHWLPEQGYLLTRARIFLDISETPEQPAQQIFLANNTISYREIQQRFLPASIVRTFSNGRTHTNEIIEVRDANPDRSFYTAESLDLDTPRRPIPRWYFLTGTAIACMVIGLVLRSRKSSKA